MAWGELCCKSHPFRCPPTHAAQDGNGCSCCPQAGFLASAAVNPPSAGARRCRRVLRVPSQRSAAGRQCWLGATLQPAWRTDDSALAGWDAGLQPATIPHAAFAGQVGAAHIGHGGGLPAPAIAVQYGIQSALLGGGRSVRAVAAIVGPASNTISMVCSNTHHLASPPHALAPSPRCWAQGSSTALPLTHVD